eukprot:6201232-Pleurochrysis_carterae.AAC.1
MARAAARADCHASAHFDVCQMNRKDLSPALDVWLVYDDLCPWERRALLAPGSNMEHHQKISDTGATHLKTCPCSTRLGSEG